MKETKYIEIHKVNKEKVNLIFFKNGDAISSEILSPFDFDCNNTDELIGRIKQKLNDMKINYQIKR